MSQFLAYSLQTLISNKGDEVGHTAWVDEMGNSYKILAGNLEENRPRG